MAYKRFKGIVLTPKALRSIRLALGMSISQFAERIGLTPSEVSAMERGEMTLSGIGKALERLAPPSTPSGKQHSDDTR